MSDARVFANLPELESLLEEEASYLEELDVAVCQRLASLTVLSPMAFRDLVLRGTHVSLAYVYRKVIHELSREPYCLAVGDLLENVRQLAAVPAPGPTEVVSHKLWTCLVVEGRSEAEL
eukprot:4303012-Amphidinium_carterae.1